MSKDTTNVLKKTLELVSVTDATSTVDDDAIPIVHKIHEATGKKYRDYLKYMRNQQKEYSLVRKYMGDEYDLKALMVKKEWTNQDIADILMQNPDKGGQR